MRTSAIAALLCVLMGVAGGGCASTKARSARATPEILNAEQALARFNAAMARHQLRKAKMILDKVQFTQAERPKYEPLVRLALADATFYLGDDLSLIEARSKYLDFVTLYNDHKKAPYAQFQAGMCSSKQAYNATRDQAQRQVSIDDFKEVDKRWPESGWARAARQSLAKGQDGLAEHEFVIGYFYWKKKSYQAANDRFTGLLEKFPLYGQKDKIYYWIGRSFMSMRSPAEGRVWLDQVLNDYPRSKYANPAKALLADSAKKDAAAAARDAARKRPS